MDGTTTLDRTNDTNIQGLKESQSNTSDIILPLIVLIVLVVFLGGMLFLLIDSRFQTSSPSDPVSTDTRTQSSIKCAPGQCATNIQSGFKTCPIQDASLVINPAESICNSRFACDNPLTPYALQSDGSTNINGVCEPNIECSCLRVAQCPEYVLSIFTVSDGNPYQSVSGQRITFPQESAFVNTSGEQTSVPPIQIVDPSTSFCMAPISFLPLSSPGCNFVSAPDGNAMSYQDVLLCFGSPRGCSGLLFNPCLEGTLAFVTGTPDTLTQTNMVNAQLACVRGESCPCGQVAIFDTNFGGIVCRSLPP